jgi:group I intron endonuclease
VLGFNHNEVTKNKIKLARTGTKHSEETKLKIGSYRGIELVVPNLETKETVIYYSVRQAARELNTSSITIRRYIKSQKAFGGVYLIREKEISSP